MKKYFACLLALAALLLSACGKMPEADPPAQHKIGVATYNVKDAQVQMFKEYLDQYVAECFPDVTFLYSDSIGSGEEMMAFLQTCADSGAEGMMFFYTANLQKEVAFCAEHGMYVIRPSGNASEAEFQAVQANPFFLGEIGPGAQAEYAAAAAMTKALAKAEGQYVILSGGAFAGNEMHRQRTIGMLDTLQQLAGCGFGQSSEALAVSAEPTEAQAGGLKVLICPGYVELEQFGAPAAEAITSGEYEAVLSAVPVTGLMDALNAADVSCGVIDCFSEDNFYGFQKGKIAYVAGKFQSEIGPAFAALYNAVTGSPELYRVDGNAFRLVQGYWTAESEAEYNTMYALARGTAVNAYNYEDLYSAVKLLNPEASFAQFRALTEAYTYVDCANRRGGTQ